MSEQEESTIFDSPKGPDKENIIFHVDIDCFYAACERLRNPELTHEPIVIGMGYEEGKTHSVVATASYEAREAGELLYSLTIIV